MTYMKKKRRNSTSLLCIRRCENANSIDSGSTVEKLDYDYFQDYKTRMDMFGFHSEFGITDQDRDEEKIGILNGVVPHGGVLSNSDHIAKEQCSSCVQTTLTSTTISSRQPTLHGVSSKSTFSSQHVLRVSRVDSLSLSRRPSVFQAEQFCWGLGEGALVTPEGLAFTNYGQLMIADPGQHCVLLYNKKGSLVKRIHQNKVTRLLGDWKLQPQCIACDNADRIWLTDMQDKSVRIFSEEGKCLGSFGEHSYEQLPSELYCPYGIALTKRQDVILTHCSDVISVHNMEGQMKLEIREEGNFWYLVADDHGRILASDCDGHCIKAFSQDGQHLMTFGSKGCSDGQLHYPHGICLDNAGDVIVADSLNNRLCRFSSDGRFIENILQGKRSCHWPRAVASDSSGHVTFTWQHSLAFWKTNINSERPDEDKS